MVAVVIPIYKHFWQLNLGERISLSQCFKTLSAYDTWFVTHQAIDIMPYLSDLSDKNRIKIVYFQKDYFESLKSYSQLLLSYKFYKAFENYEYVLISQLDVFVFKDDVKYFISLGYDYIGAPWFENYDFANQSSKIIGAGNGGFSLRKVSSFIAVLRYLEAYQIPISIRGLIKSVFKHPFTSCKILVSEILRFKYSSSIFPWKFQGYEDIFWANHVKLFFPWFKVGNIKDSTEFSFEVNPGLLFKMNNNKLPMAAHAWERYDIDFWKPYIESYGYKVAGD